MHWPRVHDMTLLQGLCDGAFSGMIPCRPMIELLLARLPADLRTHAIKRIARFVTSTSLPSVAGETGILCSVPSWLAPQETALHLAAPLLARLQAELPVLQKAAAAPGGMHISKVCSRVSSSPFLQVCNCSTLQSASLQHSASLLYLLCAVEAVLAPTIVSH